MNERPNPEELLVKYGEKSKTGKLTVFLGAAAGVGKTTAMLKAIPELLNDGIDVVIGYIETHNRKETHALLPNNVETIPLIQIERKGHQLKELNIDAILRRKPQLVVIDELAHANIPGSRNAKRYQDVLEILAAGIDVYTALNIQHIESLNDVVGQITGINIIETVPDSVLEEAEEIKLIDVTPDELIDRLKDGKIYQKERTAAALNNFFRKGNLTALREMALLRTAQKVQDQVQEYRTEKSISEVWASHENLMVVLEPGYSSEKIIRSGKTMVDKGFSRWYVVYVDDGKFETKSFKEKEKLLKLLDLARQLGAETRQLAGSNPTETIVNFARQNNINTVVLSQYRLSLYYRLFGTTLVAKLTELAPELNLHLIRDEFVSSSHEQLIHKKAQRKINPHKVMSKIFLNLLIFTPLGIIMYPLANYIHNENILMIYLLVIILSNHGRGKLSAFIAALIATISFDFFFIPPRLSFAIADLQYGITFVIMAGVGIAFSIVNGNLRFQVNKLAKAQRQIKLVYDASKSFAEAMIEEQAIEVVREYMPQLFAVKYAILLPSLSEEITIQDGSLEHQGIDLTIAKWVFDNGKAAGLKTATFAASKLFYLPVNSKIRTRGVLIFSPDDELEFFLPEEQTLLDNLASNLATTLERIHFTQIAIQTEVALMTQINNRIG